MSELTIGKVAHLHHIVMDLALHDPEISPYEVLSACEDETIFDLILARGAASGVDVSSVAAMYSGGEPGRVLLGNLSSWANVIDVQRKYGMHSDGSNGWMALSFGFLDQFYALYAYDAQVTW